MLTYPYRIASGSGMPGSRQRADNDVYTMLVITACVFVVFAIIAVIVRSGDLLGTHLPGLSN